jgi:hypothetical protein
LDQNDGNTIGVGEYLAFRKANHMALTFSDTGWTQASVGFGKRSSSATSYLGPKYINRPNLSVLLHARATKVVQTGKVKGVPLFGAVDFASSPTCALLGIFELTLRIIDLT